jgi:ABC-type glycerol-3-phosphate transport system permease component
VALYVLGKFVFGGGLRDAEQGGHRLRHQTRAGRAGLLVLLPFAVVILVALTPHLGVVATSLARPGKLVSIILPTAFTLNNYVEALGTK